MRKPALALILSTLAMFVVPALAEAAKCPVINGTFAMDTTVNGEAKRFGFRIFTKEERGVISYGHGTENGFLPADGRWRPVVVKGVSAKTRNTCLDKRSVLIETMDDADSAITWAKITFLDVDNILYETEAERQERIGRYSRINL